MNTLVDTLRDPSLEARELPLSLLQDITQNFSPQLELGGGGFGTVYKGLLPNGMMVAVKRLNIKGQVLDDKLFDAELDSMRKLRNKNVVRLLGYCVHTVEKQVMFNGQMFPKLDRERLLCLEFVPHGPIQKAGAVEGAPWEERYKIIKGICDGLEYIHDKGYIHLDLKPDNILLDKDMVPKLADFGMTRFFGDENTRNTVIGGTMGYTAPECIDDGTLSSKADIYSFGTVIFDVMTGSKGPKAHQKTQEEKDVFLQQALFAWKLQLMTTLRGRAFVLAYQQVEICLKIALNCKDNDRHCRRSAKQISHILNLTLDPYILEPRNLEAAVSVMQFSSVEDMDLHPSKPWILLSRSSGHIEISNYRTKVSMGLFEVSKKPVHSAKFLEGNSRWNILAGDDRGFLHVCKLKEDEEEVFKVKTIMATGGKGIRSLAIHPSKRYVLLSTGSCIMIWNTEDWTCMRMHHGPSYFKTVNHASFNTNDDKEFGIGCCDGTVKLWSHASLTSTRRPYLILGNHSDQVCSMDYFTCDSATFVVTGSMDRTAKVWKYDDKPTAVGFGLVSIAKPEATFRHAGGVTATCYVPELKVILTGTNDGVVSVWCAQTYRQKRLLCFGLGRISNLACHSAARWVFIGHEHGLVCVHIDPKKL